MKDSLFKGTDSLHTWNPEDKPREKLDRLGARALTDAELLAIMLGSGTKGKNVVALSNELLDYVNGDLSRLSELTVHDMCNHFQGIGEVKAQQIVATLEFGRRRSETKGKDTVIRSSSDIVDLMYGKLADNNIEEFWVILLNRRNKVIGTMCLAQGGVSGVLVDVRVVMKAAIERLASALIICHNHPSGSARPSAQDRDITRKIGQAAQVMDISLLDHVIITPDKDLSYSFADNGEI